MKERTQSKAKGPVRLVLLVCLFLAAWAASTAAARAQQERRIEFQGAIGYGERVIGPLQPDVVAQVWQFQGSQGQEISIAMNALTEELDPFLLLLAMSEADLEEFFALSDDEMADLVAVAEERGLLLELNDDRDQDTNALIPSFVLPADGSYTIVATSCCTGDSSGRYELLLDLIDQQAPDVPEPINPEIGGYTPGEGQAGTELIMTLEGENLPVLGDPVGVIIANVELPILDFEQVDDQTLQMALFLPPETPAGQYEILFFFENGSFDGPFFVFEPDVVDPGAQEPDDVDPRDEEPPAAVPPPDDGSPPAGDPPTIVDPPDVPWPTIGAVLLFVALGGALVWRRIRRPPSPPQPPQQAPPPPPGVRFELQRDAGRQSLETTGDRLTAGVDIRFRLQLEQSTHDVDENQALLGK